MVKVSTASLIKILIPAEISHKERFPFWIVMKIKSSAGLCQVLQIIMFTA